jgi:PmbA protein
MSDMLELARLACREAVNAGADFADVSLSTDRKISVSVEKSGIHNTQETTSAGVSVRAIVNGATAFVAASETGKEEVRKAARDAAEAAKLAQPDPDFVSLPEKSEYREIDGLYDDRIAAITVGQLINTVGEGIDEAREVHSDVTVSGSAGLSVSRSVLVNSLGIEAESQHTSASTYYFCVVRKGDDVGSFYDFTRGRVLDDYQPDGLGRKACEGAVSFLGARSMRSGTFPVIAGPLASDSIFESIASAASAEHIQRKRSWLVDKLGKKIGTDLLAVTDDAFIPRGLGSGPFDGEGAVRTPVTIVEDGILLSHLHGSYTANKEGVANTGHGTRGKAVSSTNVNPRLGDTLAADIIRDTKEGIYITLGSLEPKLASGEVSSTVDFGFKIENGELAYPLKSTMIGMNAFDMLANIDVISSDYRQEPGQILPTVRIQNAKIAGSD